jgi:hypothetical protein
MTRTKAIQTDKVKRRGRPPSDDPPPAGPKGAIADAMKAKGVEISHEGAAGVLRQGRA